AVVVPSPATSLVLVATSRRRTAPRFSIGSFSSMSLAMVTPSLITRGRPNLRSRTTLRPLGPSVMRTALASTSMPRFSASRASMSKITALAISVPPDVALTRAPGRARPVVVRDQHSPVTAERARRDPDSGVRLAPLVLAPIEAPHDPLDQASPVAQRDEFRNAAFDLGHVACDVSRQG